MDTIVSDKMRDHPRPSFVFIGPSKAGSSWFFEILREHPQVFVPSNKATFFFTDHYSQGIGWYERFFFAATHQLAIGEVCHDYLANPDALRRISRYRADMRLVCCLRNPYARALSSWRFFGRNGMDQPTLTRQGELNPSVFDQGNYATQIAFVHSLFPQHQLLIFFFEEIEHSPASVANRLYEFLGVDANFVPPSLHRRVNVNAKPRSRPLARLVQNIHALSWKRSRALSNLIGRLKRVGPLRRCVRYALYKEPRASTDWREHLPEFPAAVISRYESEISALERMLNHDLTEWRASPAEWTKPRSQAVPTHGDASVAVNGQAVSPTGTLEPTPDRHMGIADDRLMSDEAGQGVIGM